MTGHRSVSQYTTYVQCGEAYRLERVAKAPQTPAAWFVQGTAVHAAVEAYELSYRALTAAEAVKVFGDDIVELRRIAKEVAAVLEKVPGTADVRALAGGVGARAPGTAR